MEQWHDLINPGRQGTVDEHLGAGLEESSSHPTEELPGVLVRRSSMKLRELVDIEQVVFDGACRIPALTKAKSSTTSGAFFAESLSATRGGGQMNPGAMLQTSIKQPGPRAATIMPGSPTSRHATSRMSLRGPSDSPLPATSPRRLARQDGRSGTVVIWGDGWARSASPAKPREGPVTVYTPTKVPVANAFDATMHPVATSLQTKLKGWGVSVYATMTQGCEV